MMRRTPALSLVCLIGFCDGGPRLGELAIACPAVPENATTRLDRWLAYRCGRTTSAVLITTLMYDLAVNGLVASLLAATIVLTQGCGGSGGTQKQDGAAGDSSIAGTGGAGGLGGSNSPGGAGGSGGVAVDAGGDRPSDADAHADSGAGGSDRCRKTTFLTGFVALPGALIDVNGDQVPDLVAPEAVFSAPEHLAIAAGDGLGSFRQPASLTVELVTAAFAGGDFDADGNSDLVGLSDTGKLQLFRGTGSGQLAAATQVTTLSGNYANSVVVGDFNGDGKPDIAAGASSPGRIEVFLGQGDRSFRSSVVTAIGQLQSPLTLLPGDFDEDGHKDLLVYAAAQAGGQALLLLGRGDGGFSMQQIFSLVSITGLASADLDRDGHADLVATYGNNYLTVQLGAGDGTFSGVTGLRPNTKAQSYYPTIADVSGDGIPDVIMGNKLPYSMGILVGHGDGSFDDGVSISLDANSDSIRAGDLNRDGVADLVTFNGTDGVDIYLGPCR